ncbi:MAG: glycosyltransferase family 4 protein [Kiritimatiellia bacterium]|nr:glycosyltransferase family 4 protein [Kiritimatiellia bacterium]
MKILVVSNLYPPDIVGGAEVLAERLCSSLATRHTVSVLTTRGQPGPPVDELQNGVRVRRIWPGGLFLPTAGTPFLRHWSRQITAHVRDLYNPHVARAVQQLAEEIRPDLLHTHNLYGLSPSAWSAARRSGLPVCHTAHDAYLLCPRGVLYHGQRTGGPLLRLYRAWYRAQVAQVDLLVVPSHHHLDLHLRYGMRARDSRIIFNGRPGGESPERDRPTRKSGPLRVLYLGQMERHKGVRTLLEAVELCQRDGVALRVDMAGRGRLRPEVQAAMARGAPIVDHGFVTGTAKNDLFKKADVLLYPSLVLESAPLAILEAFSAHLPVITTAIGGQQEYARPGRAGFLFPPGDATALANLLKRLADAPEQLRDLKPGMLEAAEDARFDLMVSRYEEAYADLRKARQGSLCDQAHSGASCSGEAG